MSRPIFHIGVLAFLLSGCEREADKIYMSSPDTQSPIEKKLAQYITVRLTADLSRLTENERRMIPLLIEAARSMDAIFWQQAFDNRDSLLESIREPATRRRLGSRGKPYRLRTGQTGPAMRPAVRRNGNGT